MVKLLSSLIRSSTTLWKARGAGPQGRCPAGAAFWSNRHCIRDFVAIVGMGCTQLGEHWDKGADEFATDATSKAFDRLA